MSKKIMLVDDAAFMRMMIKNTLTQNGYDDIIEAKDGVEAVQKYKLRFTFGGSNLGEDIRSITVSVDDGTPLPETGSA